MMRSLSLSRRRAAGAALLAAALGGLRSAEAAVMHGPVVGALHAVAVRCVESQAGYRTAAAHVNSLDLRTLFHRHAQRRGDFASELQQHLARLGATLEANGRAPQGWLTVTEAAVKDDPAIVKAVVRSEEGVLQTYAEALQHDLPADVRNALRRQEAEIQRQLETIKARREAPQP